MKSIDRIDTNAVELIDDDPQTLFRAAPRTDYTKIDIGWPCLRPIANFAADPNVSGKNVAAILAKHDNDIAGNYPGFSRGMIFEGQFTCGPGQQLRRFKSLDDATTIAAALDEPPRLIGIIDNFNSPADVLAGMHGSQTVSLNNARRVLFRIRCLGGRWAPADEGRGNANSTDHNEQKTTT